MKKDFKFNNRASSYDKGFEGKFSKKFYNLLLNQIELKDGDNLLDVGCGTGKILRELSDKYDINGYGIDVEENMVKIAKEKCPNMNIQISNSDKMPFVDNKFDILTACMAYHHFDDKISFAEEAGRVMKIGAYLYIVDPKFPKIIRIIMNSTLKQIGIVGKFETSQEIYNTFEEFGFELIESESDSYAQLVKLKKVK
ncbi:class I SAM-dependent methyltransferase [Methanobrevibacter sp. TMH8]|uniref:class I SAM-dependent methyltransferase n=1 Tax=Methanobrevibacter sp. TMH8 TaxID=2848611 RepID=UPI001CC9767C|nr:class I SAM-dependent methyltransferase [Methanobrevibacter sp. TMH8]MBZ9571020.1 class I SAM-dependent methyltransferase [Methanobrevibacter sp. TMH8]